MKKRKADESDNLCQILDALAGVCLMAKPRKLYPKGKKTQVMGNNHSVEYQRGQRVLVKLGSNNDNYRSGVIVKVHDRGRYDIQFNCKAIRTIFWENITVDDDRNIQKLLNHKNQNDDGKDSNSEDSDSSDMISKLENVKNLSEYEILCIKDRHTVNKFATDFHENLIQKKSMKAMFSSVSTSNSNEKYIDFECLENMNEFLTKIGGKDFYHNIHQAYKQEAEQKLIKIIGHSSKNKKGKNFLSALKNIRILKKNEQNNDCIDEENKYEEEIDDHQSSLLKNGVNFEIQLDLDYDSVVCTQQKANKQQSFSDAFVLELSEVLKMNSDLIRVQSIKRGSVIISACVLGCVIGLFLTGCLSAQEFFFKFKNIESMGIIGEKSVAGVVCIRDEIFVEYKRKIYNAEIIKKYEDKIKAWIVVKYVGKPFKFFNVEKISLDSDRLHLKEPGVKVTFGPRVLVFESVDASNCRLKQ